MYVADSRVELSRPSLSRVRWLAVPFHPIPPTIFIFCNLPTQILAPPPSHLPIHSEHKKYTIFMFSQCFIPGELIISTIYFPRTGTCGYPTWQWPTEESTFAKPRTTLQQPWLSLSKCTVQQHRFYILYLLYWYFICQTSHHPPATLIVQLKVYGTQKTSTAT